MLRRCVGSIYLNITSLGLQKSGPGLATPLPKALAAQRKAANPRERAGEKPEADVEYP